MATPLALAAISLPVSADATGREDSPALDSGVRQLLIGLAADESAMQGTLFRFERGSGEQWRALGRKVPVLFGKRGIAWGRGVRGEEQAGSHKREGDGRTPAGLFALGTIFGNDAQLPDGADYLFHQVTAVDAWPDDPQNPFYNQHVVIDPKNPPPWFASQKMRTGDDAYRWRVEIKHNTGPIVPGAGSATFFHIRRGPTRPTAACTTMAESDLREIVIWLRAPLKPHYALLTRADYVRLWRDWGLPSPTQLGIKE